MGLSRFVVCGVIFSVVNKLLVKFKCGVSPFRWTLASIMSELYLKLNRHQKLVQGFKCELNPSKQKIK